MAKARMLHKTISISEQVNNLPLPAQLLFTWLIPHADDEGRLKGNAKHIKVMVVPSHDWTPTQIQSFLEEINRVGLIYYWENDGQHYIEFPNWKNYQYIAKDRFHKSLLPSYKDYVDGLSTERIQSVTKMITQANVVEGNIKEIKKSEDSKKSAVKSLKDIFSERRLSNEVEYKVSNKDEAAALYAWKALEPENKIALQTTYLNAVRRGVNAHMIYQFVSEIKQDRTIKNTGQVFNKKVDDYCRLKEDDKS